MERTPHSFGGDWTEDKLTRLREYLAAYKTLMKRQSFHLEYIDAFAGTGYRNSNTGDEVEEPDLAILAGEEPQGFLEGSARIALQVEPPFDTYTFIEKDPSYYQELQQLSQDFPALADRINTVNTEANAYLQQRCRENWRDKRAVLFLDPYGMSVAWETIEAIARTHAIDLWYLFPLGVAVNRLLMRQRNRIPEGWSMHLDRIFGTHEWYDAFYTRTESLTLFGTEENVVKCGDFTAIAEFLLARLRSIFPGVAPNPLPLCNSHNNPLYLLCFAASNERGADIAIRIARHILKVR